MKKVFEREDPMKKDKNLAAALVLNAFVLALVYRPLLDKLMKQCVGFKKESNIKNKKTIDKRTTIEVLEAAKSKLEMIGYVIRETLMTSDIEKQDIIDFCEQLHIIEENYLIPIDEDVKSSTSMVSTASVSSEKLKRTILKQWFGIMAVLTVFPSNPELSIKDFSDYLETSVIESLKEFSLDEKEHFLLYSDAYEIIKESTPYTTEEKVEAILTSGVPNERKWNRLFALDEITLDQVMEIAMEFGTEEEILQFIVQTDRLTIEQKVWYALMLLNVPFETILDELLTIDNANQNQIIQNIIDSDMVSFETLFHAIIKLEGLTKEQLVDYLSFYHTDYHDISLEKSVCYLLEWSFSKEDKIDYIWALLDKYSLLEKKKFILEFYDITPEEYKNIYWQSVEDLDENQQMAYGLLEKVYQEEALYILENYSFNSRAELDILVAGVAAEGANHYDDLYCVINVIFNRMTSRRYVEKGESPYLQFISEGQFAVYETGKYLMYLYPRNELYAQKYAVAQQAVYDMLFAAYNGIAHNYTQFRSWSTESFSDVYIVKEGNRYRYVMSESSRIQYENLLNEEIQEEECYTLLKEYIPHF